MGSKLLVVEVSGSMRRVLGDFVATLDFDVTSVESFAAAEHALASQYRHYDTDFAAVLLGWPSVPDHDATALIGRLDSAELVDLPVIVLSTDMRAEVRAWSAGRQHTMILPWKDYQRIEWLLPDLLDAYIERVAASTLPSDHGDIRLLIVDDSANIRRALQALFTGQGYPVSLAAGREDALALARSRPHDIAIVDFYLDDGTGDTLVRELIGDPACGDIACTVLSGTLADHIVRRSLLAGAVECLFKGESNEMLLARVAAIGRLVRQRHQATAHHRRLSQTIEMLGEAVLVADDQHRVRYCSGAFARLLGYAERAELLAQPPAGVFATPDVALSAQRAVELALIDRNGNPVRLHCQVEPATTRGEWLVRVKPTLADSATAAARAAAAIARRLRWPPSSEPFIEMLVQRDASPADSASPQLLMMQVRSSKPAGEGTGDPVSDADLQALMARPDVAAAINQQTRVVARCAIGDGRLVLLIDAGESSAMQRYLQHLLGVLIAGPVSAQGSRSATAAVTSLAANGSRSVLQMLHRLQGSQALLAGRERNCALLLDVKRLVPADH